MKRVLSVLAAAAVLAACADSPTAPATTSDVLAKKGGEEGGGGRVYFVEVTPESAEVLVGYTIQLTAVAKDRRGNVLPDVAFTWSSSDPSVAEVSEAGFVTGISVGGPVTVSASTDGKKPATGSATVTVPSDLDGFIVFHIGPQGGGAGDWDIYRMNPDGTGIVPLTDDAFDNRVGAVSPDGKTIAFTSNRSGVYAIHTMNMDGSGISAPIHVLQRCCGEATWSPEGNRLAFNDGADASRFEIYVLDLGTGLVRQVTNVGFAERASWSPDGTRLAYGAIVPDGWQIFTVSLDGSAPVALTPGVGWSPAWLDMYPRWCHSGRIAFQSRRSGYSAIYTMASDGSDVRQVSPSASENFDMPVCSPTGRWLAYRAHDRADIYRTAADGTSVFMLYDGVDHTGVTSWGRRPER
jgi:Tol biopolymer transport system component